MQWESKLVCGVRTHTLDYGFGEVLIGTWNNRDEYEGSWYVIGLDASKPIFFPMSKMLCEVKKECMDDLADRLAMASQILKMGLLDTSI